MLVCDSFETSNEDSKRRHKSGRCFGSDCIIRWVFFSSFVRMCIKSVQSPCSAVQGTQNFGFNTPSSSSYQQPSGSECMKICKKTLRLLLLLALISLSCRRNDVRIVGSRKFVMQHSKKRRKRLKQQTKASLIDIAVALKFSFSLYSESLQQKNGWLRTKERRKLVQFGLMRLSSPRIVPTRLEEWAERKLLRRAKTNKLLASLFLCINLTRK